MNPGNFFKRYGRLSAVLVLVILGLILGVVRPALGLREANSTGLNNPSPGSAGLQTADDSPSFTAITAVVTPEVLYYHQDATGNLAAMTDEGGAVVWRSNQRPFGQGKPTSLDHSLRFAGQPQDAISGGLFHLGAREYDPLTGRFLSPDPVSLAAVKLDSPQRFNQYSYALNNPYRYHDAGGLTPDELHSEAALMRFLQFYMARLGLNPSPEERKAIFSSQGALTSQIWGQKPGQDLIKNRSGQGVLLYDAQATAGNFVQQAEKDQPLWGSLTPYDIATKAKSLARSAIIDEYSGAFGLGSFQLWLDDYKMRYPGYGRYHYFDVAAQIRGAELLIDFIVYGGDLRDFFELTKLPPQKAKE